MRDKLIEIISSECADVLMSCADECDNCPSENCIGCLADRLIANGVTFATDNNVGCKWIPVSERLPKESGYYLVHHKGGFVSERYFYEDAPEIFAHVRNYPVTHWMPLPAAPKEVE